jgi:hypothetical protein
VVAGTIPIKTPDGQTELSTRQRRLSQRHRTVLFLIDGKRSATEVKSMALQAGVPDTCFDELLAQGLIVLPEPTPSVLVDLGAAVVDTAHVDLPLAAAPVAAATAAPATSGVLRPAAAAAPDSLLPPSRTLYPTLSADSTLGDSPVPDSWLPSDSGSLGQIAPAVAEARLVLLRAVRAEAPLAGSLTLMRLRRARSRADLLALLDEVELRITKPHRSLAANQTMRRVRALLGDRVDSTFERA